MKPRGPVAAALALAVTGTTYAAGGQAWSRDVGTPARPVTGTTCPTFPADNYWHADASKLPVDPRGRRWLSHMSTGVELHPDFGPSFGDGPNYGIPITVVGRSHPRVRVHFQYADESAKVRYPLGRDTRIEGGRRSSGDRHAIMVDRDTCRLYETYATRKRHGTWYAGSGATWSLKSDALRPNGWTSADAAGLPILPGLLRWNEVKHRDIDHAIRFTTDITSQHHLWPARHDAGSRRSWAYPPMGARFRLRASYHPHGFGPRAMAVVRAMKKYGLVLADNGSPWYFQGEQNSHWPSSLIEQLKRIPASKFVAVDTSSLQPANSGATSRRTTKPDWFTTRAGKPQLVVSAEDWGLLANGGLDYSGNWKKTYDNYFATRKKQGYNAVEVSVFSFTGLDGGHNGPDWDGTEPFTPGTNPRTAPNPTFWARRDYFLRSAARHGFRVFLNVTTPYLHQASPNTAFTRSWSTTQWNAFGRFLGHRYAARHNIMWMVGDDYYDDIDSGLTALLRGLRAASARQPISIQNYQESSSRYDNNNPTDRRPWGYAHAQFNVGYSYNVSYDVVENMAQEPNPIPYFWADGYFLEMASGSITTDQMMRRMIWWALSSGSKGFQVGDNDVWTWSSSALGLVKTKAFYRHEVPAIASYFRSLPHWSRLTPDIHSRLVTAGRGTHTTGLPAGGYYDDNSDSYVTASRTPSGSLAVIYLSHPRKITINPKQLVAHYTGTWVDPANGATSRAGHRTTYDSGSKGKNSNGDVDWVLVLKAPRR